jgi:uncharacterized membrane protein
LALVAVFLLCLVGFPTMAIWTVITHPVEAVPVLLILCAIAVALLVWAMVDSFRRGNEIVDDAPLTAFREEDAA